MTNTKERPKIGSMFYLIAPDEDHVIQHSMQFYIMSDEWIAICKKYGDGSSITEYRTHFQARQQWKELVENGYERAKQ